jgi:hypothetical protein
MQIIKQWPQNDSLKLSETEKKALVHHLIEPFGDEQTAHEFWNEYPSTIIILDEADVLDTLQKIDKETQFLIDSALNTPEYSEPLAADYTINLAITNDDGTGVYLVLSNCSELLKNRKQD